MPCRHAALALADAASDAAARAIDAAASRRFAFTLLLITLSPPPCCRQRHAAHADLPAATPYAPLMLPRYFMLIVLSAALYATAMLLMATMPVAAERYALRCRRLFHAATPPLAHTRHRHVATLRNTPPPRYACYV